MTKYAPYHVLVTREPVTHKTKSGREIVSYKTSRQVKVQVFQSLNLALREHRYEDDGTQWKERMARLRQQVESELLEPSLEHGGDRKSSVHVHLKDETPKGNSRARRIKTLKRDAPDIAERVINNELSAAAGMRELRIRNGEPEELRRAVNMLDARSTFNSLVKFMPDDVLQELIDLLNDKERP